MSPVVIALLAHKGGVGKTTATVGLAEALAEEGHRVLAVDMDPQGNLTRRLGVENREQIASISDVLALVEGRPVEKGSASQIILPSRHPRIAVAPANMKLDNRTTEAHAPGAVRRLAKVMDGAIDGFSVVLIDTPPALNHLVQMAIVWAGEEVNGRPRGGVVVVTNPEKDGVEGAVRSAGFVQAWREDLYIPQIETFGVIVNAVRSQTRLHRAYMTALDHHFEGKVWSPYLPNLIEMGEVMSEGVPMKDGAPVLWPLMQKLALNLTGGA